MKKLLFFILCPFFLFGQIQIGQDIIGEGNIDRSGWCLNLSSDGSIVAIGAPFNDGNGDDSGHVRIYKNINNVWQQVGNDINGEAAADFSGWSLSLSSDGSIVAIGAPSNLGNNNNNSGHVRIYKNTNNIWQQVGNDIDGEAAADSSGWSLSLSSDGSIVAIGATRNSDNGNNSGHVRIYKNTNNIWQQIGDDINGEGINDSSATTLSLSSDGSIVAIGATGKNNNGDYSGGIRIYKNTNNVWQQVGNDINGEAAGDEAGRRSLSLSSDGSIVAFGAPLNDGNGDRSGHVRVYKNLNNNWIQIGDDIDGEAPGIESGYSLSLSSDGSIIAIGAPSSYDNGPATGHVKIYKNTNNVWQQIGIDIDGEFENDNLGSSLSLNSDGSIVAIGSSSNLSGNSTGKVRIFDLSAILSSDSFVLSKFNMYPNPVKDLVTIELKNNLKLKKISLYNNLGQFIKSTKNLKINTSNLKYGIYFIQIETNKGKATKKLVIN